MQTSGVGIVGMGVFLPDQIRENSWWPPSVVDAWGAKSGERVMSSELQERMARMPPGVQATLKAMSELRDDPFRGAKQRRVMPEGMKSSDMELQAAREALQKSGLRPDEIDALIVYSSLPDYLTVSNGPLLHEKLGLPERCLTISVDSACSSFLSQLAVAEPLIRGGAVKNALLVQSNGCVHLCRADEPHSAWFGDAASAQVLTRVSPGKGILAQAHRTDGSLFGGLVGGWPGKRWHKAAELCVYIEDPMAARKMMMRVVDLGTQIVGEALAAAELNATDVDFYASHQATPWFRRVTQECCGLTRARSVDTWNWTTNIVAVNIPLQLYSAEREGTLRDGDVVASYTGGSGITWSSVIWRWGR